MAVTLIFLGAAEPGNSPMDVGRSFGLADEGRAVMDTRPEKVGTGRTQHSTPSSATREYGK